MDLGELAADRNIRDPRKLYQYAKSRGIEDVTIKQAAEVLRNSTQRQLLAPQVRYQGTSQPTPLETRSRRTS